MSSLDIVGLLREGLAAERKPREPKLYCSGDLIGSLRHSQLKVAGAPRIESDLVSDIRLRTGTMWHDYLCELLVGRGLTVMQEVRLSPWLPEGWGGRADILAWDAKARAFDLWDVKTTKGEGLQYVAQSAKDEHIWQMSAYWHALRVGKFPMLKKCHVLYLPMNWAEGDMEPIVQDIVPIPKDVIWKVMEDRWAATKRYIDSLDADYERAQGGVPFVTPELAPPMARIQKLFKKGDIYEVKWVPHWSTRFCEFPDELCDCNTQGTTKIGEWRRDTEFENTWAYFARKGYEDTYPENAPGPTKYRAPSGAKVDAGHSEGLSQPAL